jgi:hypothetical protein
MNNFELRTAAVQAADHLIHRVFETPQCGVVSHAAGSATTCRDARAACRQSVQDRSNQALI